MATALDCLLIADDFTGACDAAAPFAAAGRRAVAALSATVDGDAFEVVAVSTESRNLPACEVRAAMRQAAARLPCAARAVFLKIDSTLRGNTAAEIAAALETFACRAAVVCPAFPAMHRVVRQGLLTVATAPDFSPVDLARHVAGAHIEADKLLAAVACGERVLCLDATCDADLDRLAAGISTLEGPILWVGSAGLASALARSLGPGEWRAPELAVRGPALFCIGSDHPVTLAQQAALVESRGAMLVDAGSPGVPIGDALARGQHVLARIPRDPAAAGALRQRLAGVAPAALVLSGGDTASLVCAALGVHGIQLCTEIVPGIPRGILRGGAFDGAAVVTKSGGFGRRDAMIVIADYFSCPNR